MQKPQSKEKSLGIQTFVGIWLHVKYMSCFHVFVDCMDGRNAVEGDHLSR